MPTNVIMPQLGESVVEGTISRWLVKEGDTVEKYDVLMEVSTDKVDTEVPSPASGVVLKLYYPEGVTLHAGTVIAAIGQPGESVPEQPDVVDLHASAQHEPEPLQPAEPIRSTPLSSQPAGGEIGRISPVVSRIAREHNVDLRQVAGTGRDGRITKKDVLAYVEAGDARQSVAPAEIDLPAWERPGTGDLFKPTDDLPLTTAEARSAASVPQAGSSEDQLIPHPRLRKLIAEHMVASVRTSPHVTSVMEADLTAVVAHRAARRAEFAAKDVNLTFTPYFIQAVIEALKVVPQVNAVYREDGLLLKRRYNIGMATAVPDGLLVPVIHDADDYSLLGLARKVNDLAARARSNKLTPDEIQGSTFTVTNHGTGGSLFATPIINQPNVGILGVGAIQKRAVVISRGHPVEPSSEDSIAIRPMAYLSFTFDHRVLDGAGGDGFLMAVKQALEGWQ
ncbi:MAG: 2-oxo acid dehydrogenase subunit E2 [Caldilineae bacterium]|nr:2-oxo acid dehydrogenase subunit E2 [Anaerolineae bacterium]MCB9153100.1 2-oxo acid dehydrogenase subunit E2 [Caldilineae bacterium]